ncbi:MAG: EAL domain-containing protein [Sulfuricurvum sp.]|nr:EAL domain-containing protein [Sulfuricurvum sp.]
MKLFTSNQFFRKAFSYGLIFKWIVLLFSLVVTVLVWSVSKNYYENRAKKLFEANVNDKLQHINRRLSMYEGVLHSGIAFFEGNTYVRREDWQHFIQALQLQKFYPGMQGVGFSLMLHRDEIPMLEQKMRREGYPSFSLKPVGDRDQYSAILYLEPMDKRNIQAIGYDMFSEPTRRVAMERARDTGLPTLTGRVKLLQEIDSNTQSGVLMYLPLYKKGVKIDTIEARRKALIGYVYSPFRLNDMMNTIELEKVFVSFEMYDGEAVSAKHLLYRSFKPSSYVPKYMERRKIQTGGRTFEIIFSSTREFDKKMDTNYPLLLTLAGFFTYYILFSIIVILYRGRIVLKSQAEALEVNRAWLETLLESSIDGIHILDFNGNLIEWSPSFIEMLGYTEEEASHLNVVDWDAKYSSDEIIKAIHTIFNSTSMMIETIHRRKDGTFFDVEMTTRPIVLESKRYIYASSRDITERKKVENELHKLSQAVEQSPNTIVITDLDGTIEYVNTAFEFATGYTKAEALGKNPRLFQSGKTPKGYYDEMWGKLLRGKIWHGEFINRRKNGTEYIEAVKVAPIFQPDGHITHYMAIKEDITEKKHAEERLHYLANFDLLTGLPNHIQLEDRINYTLKTAKRHNGEFAVMFLDLDHFKDINDALGHKSGDKLLVQAAKRLLSVIRDEDTISRLGGDEFIFLLPDVDAEGVVYVVQKLLNTMAEPFVIEQNELSVTASIGIAIYPYDGTDHETLSKNADTAMYRAKQNGRNTYCFFTQAMQDNTSRNLQLTNALYHALERNQLRVVYQPQISARNGHIIGAESLLRWTHPEFGDVSPAEFIPLAEESGLILPIGEWVLRTAVQQAKIWIDNGFEPMVIAVNLSAVQFRHPHLVELISTILDEIGLPPEYLEIELTEAVAMHDPESAYTVMDNLHARGIRMSIDDFGTGYSSLSYLKKFKVYKLKIDQSFIRNITTDAEDKAIVIAIINMADGLGLQTIAEGVETIEQLDFLREEGCHEIQGYYYSKPLSVEDFNLFVQKTIKVN